MHRHSRILVLATLLTGALCADARPAAHAPRPVPALTFRDLTGQPQSLASLRGSIAVVNFWATWCGPCKEELPHLAALQRHYGESGVRFVAISVDEPKDQAKVAPYVQTQALMLDVWLGADINTLDRLGLGEAVPATIVLDKNGVPLGRILGEATDADVQTYLDWLLSDRSRPAPPATVNHLKP